jgi:hypothetical protein
MSIAITAPFEVFLDAAGKPLEAGKIYIGAPGLNPETNPAEVYWDAAGTIPAALPIRTLGGYPAYAGSAGNLYTPSTYSITVRDRNDGIVFSSLVSGRSAGGAAQTVAAKNYITEPDFESGSTAGWSMGKDAGTTVPISGGIGGVTSFTFLSIDNADPLAGVGSMVINKPASDARGSTVYSNNIAIDLEDTVRPLQLTFSYRTPVADYVSGDISVFIWDVTNGKMIPMSMSALESTGGKPANFMATFIPSSSKVYRIIFMMTTTNVNALAVAIDSFALGPQSTVNAAAVGVVPSYTPAAVGFGTIASTFTDLSHIGNKLYGKIRFTAGTPTGVTATLTLPDGLTASVDQATIVGFWEQGTASATTVKRGTVLSKALDSKLYFSLDHYDIAYNPLVNQIGSIFVTGAVIEITLTGVPIAQWTTNVNLAGDFTQYGADLAGVDVFGPSGVTVPSIAGAAGITTLSFTFPSSWQITDLPLLEFVTSATGTQWIPMKYPFLEGTASYAFGATLTSSATSGDRVCTVAFGNGGSSCTGGLGAAGSTWATAAAAGWRWRVRKVSNGNMAEVPPVVRAEYTRSSSALPANGTAVFNTKVEDTHSAYNPSGIFTAPIAGVYRMRAVLSSNTVAGSTTANYIQIDAWKNGAVYWGGTPFYGNGLSIPMEGQIDAEVRLNAGETCNFNCGSDSARSSNSASQLCRMSITRIGS